LQKLEMFLCTAYQSSGESSGVSCHQPYRNCFDGCITYVSTCGCQVLPGEVESGQDGMAKRQNGSGSSLGSLVSSLHSLLSSSSSTGWLATAGLLPESLLLENFLPDTSPAETNQSTGGHTTVECMQNFPKAEQQPHEQQKARETVYLQPVAQQSQRSPNRRGTKRQLSEAAPRPRLTVAAKAPRLFSTPSPSPSAVEGPKTQRVPRHDYAEVEDERDSDYEPAVAQKRQRTMARKETPPRRVSPQPAAGEGPFHVPKSTFKGVSCHKCASSEIFWDAVHVCYARRILYSAIAGIEQRRSNTAKT
jgi:hypothetical protein